MSYKSSKLAKRKKKKDELALRPIKDNVLLVEERLSHVLLLVVPASRVERPTVRGYECATEPVCGRQGDC